MDEPTALRPPRELLTLRDVAAGYGGEPVVADINLSLRQGDILALLGANGSGKSTLLKAVTGQIGLLNGAVAIDGIDLANAPKRAKAQFGYAVDPADLPAVLSGRQYIELVASIRSCAPAQGPCSEALMQFGLMKWLEQPIAEYSLGTRAKLSIAAALLGEPPLLIFDESLNGLDPLANWQAKRMIASLAASGRHAVVVSTHFVEAAPTFCNRAMFLANGHISQSWDARELAEASRAPGDFERCIMRTLTAQDA